MARESGQKALVANKQVLSQVLQNLQPRLASIIPDETTLRRLIMLAQVAVSKTPMLLQCTQESLIFAVMTAAELGLDFSGALGEAYLIPFKNNTTGQYEAVFVPGYKGLRNLAIQNSIATGTRITGLSMHVVRANDQYHYIELDPETLRPRAAHQIVNPSDRGQVVAAYCIWSENGQPQIEWMWGPALEKRRKASKMSTSGAWRDWEDEMYGKVVMRHTIDKRLPISTAARAAVAIALQGEDEHFNTFDIEGGPADDPPPLPEGRSSRIAPPPPGEGDEGKPVDSTAD